MKRKLNLASWGRFAPGLPKISDGQQLFILNGLSKLAPDGRMAIIQNGSPLFSGDAGSGPSNIRQYILENDWLDAIIQLSTDQFMNTGISTYIWILSRTSLPIVQGRYNLLMLPIAMNSAESLSGQNATILPTFAAIDS